MMIIKVFDEAFTYLNNVTGELSNNYNSVNQREIRTLVIGEDEKEVIYGSLVKS
jgi:acid phosphatase family membrane protein YuiD